MLTVTKPSPNRVDLHLEGEIDAEVMRRGLDDLLKHAQDVNEGRMLYTIKGFSFPTLGAMGVEFGYLPKLFGLLGRFDRCAVCTDTGWLKTAAEVEGAMIPGLEIKGFDLDETEQAEAWLAG